MLFSLEVMQAYEGDCLILHVGNETRPHFVVIDGGPSNVYQEILEPRLAALRASKYDRESLPIDFLVVTHVDEDHIRGVLDLMQDLRKRSDDSEELPYDIVSLWHNSFEQALGDARGELFAAMGAAASPAIAPASVSPDAIRLAGMPAMAASIAQGRKLHEIARKLEIGVNEEFPGLVMYDPDDNVVDLGDDARLTVIGPDEGSIEDLRKAWKEAIKKATEDKQSNAIAAAYRDKSVANLSSIVLMAECKGKRMLLTGDARGDQILKGLQQAGFLTQECCAVDILKVPHHGSQHNVAIEFFQRVQAKHYVISADGKHGNPDLETLEMLSEARPDDRFTLHLTNKTGKEGIEAKLQRFFKGERAKRRRYKVKYRRATARSMRIDLLDKVTY